MDDGRRDGGVVQAVARALDVLEVLAAADRSMGVSDIAAATGLPAATVHRLLATLIVRGYARQDRGNRRYTLGSRLVRLGASAGDLLGTWMRPTLLRLVELSGETANLAVLEDRHVVYIAQVPSRHKVRMFTEVGNRLMPHTTAVGKVLLAFRPRAVAEDVLGRNGLPPHTPNSITDQRRFLAELDRVVQRGWALDDEEEELGVACLAVPVFGVGSSLAAMSVSGPASRLNAARRERILPEMLRLAANASAALIDEAPDATATRSSPRPRSST
ncbi:MAG: IclR family transcriptional regulator [Egibacteraceae bacterium]